MSADETLERVRAHVDERLRYYATTVQQLRARRSKASARGAMEEKSLLEQMRPYAGVLAIIDEVDAEAIVARYVDDAAGVPWKPA
ncbi:MAG TPA: hypothetical protein VJ818_03105 [Actinomycetota bacterium]|nr:hypothetical protein [Actinomycetota bacterium]